MFKNTIVNLFGMLIPGLISIPAMAYLARSLDVELFGILLLAYALVGYAGIFDAGLARAVIKKISSSVDEDLNSKIMSTALIGVLFLSLIPASFLWIFSDTVCSWLKVSEIYVGDAGLSIKLLAIVIPFFLIGTVSFAYLEGKQLFWELNKYKIITGTLIGVVPAIMVYYYSGLVSAVVGLLIARVISTIISFIALKRNLKKIYFVFSRKILVDLMTFGGWITVSNIISPLMVYADKFILSNLVGANRVVFYNAPADLIQKISILPGALAKVAFPMFSHNVKDSKMNEKNAYIGLTIALLLLLIPLFFLSGLVLNLWLGEPYGNKSSMILKVLIVGFFFNGLAQIPFSRIQALGKARITAFLHLFEVIPYLILLYFLVNSYGVIGAAYAWTIRMTLDFVLLNYFSNKY